jgi:hypothetical protein
MGQSHKMFEINVHKSAFFHIMIWWALQPSSPPPPTFGSTPVWGTAESCSYTLSEIDTGMNLSYDKLNNADISDWITDRWLCFNKDLRNKNYALLKMLTPQLTYGMLTSHRVLNFDSLLIHGVYAFFSIYNCVQNEDVMLWGETCNSLNMFLAIKSCVWWLFISSFANTSKWWDIQSYAVYKLTHYGPVTQICVICVFCITTVKDRWRKFAF